MSSASGELFFLPLQSPTIRGGLSATSATLLDAKEKCFWSDFVGDQANQALRCLLDFSQFNPEFWPLVLHGESGTGKTSVALAIAGQLATQRKLSPTIVQASDLARRYRDAVQLNSIDDFRKPLLTADVLLLDDLHLLKDKTTTQIEITKILDLIIARKSPTIVTLDSLPATHESLIPQLRSRLSSGLVLPVNRPGTVARTTTIIQRLAERFGLTLDSSAIEFIGEHCDFSVPRLTQLFSQLAIGQPTEELSSSDIKKTLFGTRVHYDRDLKLIVSVVAEHFELPENELKGKSRKQTTVLARNTAVFLARDLLEMGFTHIGRYFDGRDHSTIIHAYKKVQRLVADSDASVASIPNLKRQLTEKLLQTIDS